ncbi:non-ribosomal peptide synthetase [Streptomyces murinus]|uniref:Amino acid adenylation domain-containing protein n=1 Tax=Streptomyces murinus TaxID=33900 RepID=A0A7W3RQB7_STRMR|nr:non-ribosomal peptide synthetase [Streptomyces murinus]MBA9058137.1 amino acid adenylation domain-containing protein [Streptomyces murinus]UWW92334.1 amino acid adenylation domain-containing protein [Streptomyces murinus]
MTVPFAPRPRRDRAPLSYAQRAIWRAEQLVPGSALHNETAAFRLTGPVDADALERALAEMAARHEVMRCVITTDAAGEPYQHFTDGVRPTVERVDLTGLPEEAREVRLLELVARAAAEPLDLTRAPLMRTCLFRLGEERHLLLFVAHHIVVDAWAFGLFLMELAARYAGVGDQLPTADVDFGDYAAWQRTDPGAGAGLDHWRERLGTDLPVLALPADGTSASRPADAIAGGIHHFVIPADLVADLAVLARSRVATLPATLLAAYGAVVQRYTGQDDLVVGMPVATRNRPALGAVIGPLLNVIAHRVDLTGTPTFEEALARTKRDLKADLAHRDTPFDLVVEDLAHASGGRSPLFQLMYAFHSGPTTTLALPGVETAPMPSHSGTAKYDLSLFLRPRPSGDLDADLEYRTAALSPGTVEGIAEGLLCLLRAAVADPGRRLADLPVSTSDAHDRVVSGFNAVDRTAPPWATVPGALRTLAARAGDAPAVADADQVLTRAGSDRLADRVAARLAARHGVRPGDRVALLVPRDAALVPLVVGLWRAGAVLVPLDAHLPEERVGYVLRDSGARLVVDGLNGLDGFGERSVPADGPARVAAGELLAERDAAGAAGPSLEADGPVPFPDGPPADSLAYLMYTSGSTGRPKGVAVPHDRVANLLHSIVREPGIGAADVLVAVTALTFDISVLELFAPLVAGARVVIAPHETVRDPRRLAALLRDSGATLMQATPSLWRALLDDGWQGLPALRALSGGEPLDPALAGRLLERCAELWNLYGPTETTIWSTAGRVLPGEPVTVGRPLARTYCHILDRYDRPVPLGASGELVIGGAGVAAGYWNRPDLTATAFVPDPVAADPLGTGDPNALVYRTGDLARYLPDGRIVVLGRFDQQVKILGHRIELGEIEAQLTAHPLVRAAVVVVDRERPAAPRLVAFVVPGAPDGAGAADGAGAQDGTEASDGAETSGGAEASGGTDAPDAESGALAAELRRHLRTLLPAAVVPAVFATVAELPLNTSGKVDRPALTRTARTLDGSTAPTAPVTGTERTVLALWAELLGAAPESVGTTDDFFAAGGHSIVATRLLGRVRETLGRAPSLAAFYTDPTPKGLARAADAAEVQDTAVEEQPLPEGPVPLTDQQRQLWLTQRLAPESAAYNLAAAVRLDRPVDLAALTGALRDLATRHPVLAARCALTDEGPVLLRLPADAVRPRVHRMAEETGRDLDDVVRAEAERPFDLAEGPLLRVTVVDGDETHLLLTAHHIAVDGWSIGVAVRELAALYAVHVDGGGQLPEPSVDFLRYATAQDRPAARAVRDEHLAYWRGRLDGHPGVLELPVDPDAEPAPMGTGATVPFVLEPELTARLRTVAARLRVTPFSVLLGVYASLLGRYGGTDDVVVGVPAANRGAPGLEGLIGSLVNTLPVRVDLTGGASFAELARRTGTSLAADLDRSLVPLDRLVDALGVPRDPGRPALAQATLVLQDAPEDRLRLGDATGVLRPVSTRTAKYDLTVALAEHPDRIEGVLEYATGRFTAAWATRFTGHLRTLLRAALADPDREAALASVDPHERETPSPSPAVLGREGHAVPVHELFRARAAAHPETPAVRHDGQVVSYGTLDTWSDRIALRLRARGAAPGRFVSVLLPTGPAQTAAILGVAKTGAAFAVLDPDTPELRLRAVLADAEPVCVLAARVCLAARPGLWDAEEGTFGGVPVEPFEPLESAASPQSPPDPAGPQAPGAVEPLPAPAVTGDDTLCLVYTSGSTGAPKGIALPHATLAQFAHWQGEYLGIRPDSRVAQWAPFTYDAAYTEVFAALCHGAALSVPPEQVRRDPVAMADWLGTERVTQIQTVPGFFAVLTEALDRAGGELPHLEHVLLAGEVLPPSLAAAWADRVVRPRLHNLYGPTECVLATYRELAAKEGFPSSVPIGAPIPGRQALVLDHRGRPCPVGVAGEIHLRSDFLAGSYHRRPEESARAYVPDPWVPGGTLYRTGDLGRWLPDGELAFTGRTGSLVKINGNRVELEEIEALLEAHPAVREAAAALHGTAAAPRLIGYAVVSGEVTAEELRARLAERLPAAVVPERVLLLDALPRTRTNKRDRSLLPAPPDAAPDAAAPPNGAVEQLVADAWRRVLGADRPVGRHTNFFEAGGSSLLAARLQLDLADRLGRPVRLVDLFARPTVAEFVAGLDGPTGPGSDAPDAPADDAAARGTRRRSAVRARARGRAAARGGTASPLGTDIPTSPDAPTSSDTATGSGTPTGRD